MTKIGMKKDKWNSQPGNRMEWKEYPKDDDYNRQ